MPVSEIASRVQPEAVDIDLDIDEASRTGWMRGVRVDAIGIGQRSGRRETLAGVSLTIQPGELVAIAGGSGAGKTTLLDVLAGLRKPAAGAVRHDGMPVTTDGRRLGVGYVPQDDIIYVELPLRRTLRYAARLRLPVGTAAAEADAAVEQVLRDLDLADQADVPVHALSGGQRKRASIAVELLARPGLLFLDEPTSGLDPATAAEVMTRLRWIAAAGATVVLTTHDPAGIEMCDRVVLLARGGRLAFVGTPAQAPGHFGVAALGEVYLPLAAEPDTWAGRFATEPEPVFEPVPEPTSQPASEPASSAAWVTAPWRGWWLLTRRNVEILVHNRLTMAVLVGSPLLVTSMLAMLFQPGAFEATGPADVGPVQTVFWIAFAGFFFGLTYGLLQIVGETAVFRRERLAGLRIPAYVLAKMVTLVPVLAAVSAVLLGVLRITGRLPAAGARVYLVLFAVLLAEAVAALALGLLASAAVTTTAQAALALPMLCFPQVLFAGAIIPTGEMALPGRLIGAVMATRHAFEALGRALGLADHAGSLPALAGYGDTFTGGLGAVLAPTVTLLLFSASCALATGWTLRRRAAGTRAR